MHILDGFLDPLWCIITYIAAGSYFGVVLRKTRKNMIGTDKLSLLTVIAAGIFVAQMLNWPIPGGTSLHFVGGALAGILLGPVWGSIAMLLVLVVQCLVFHDDGITALGANLVNMAIIDVWVGFLIYRYIIRVMGYNRRNVFIAGLLGGWMGIFAAGAACSVEIGLSPQTPYGLMITLPVMGISHFLLGIIEGLITGLVLVYIYDRSSEVLLRGGVHGE